MRILMVILLIVTADGFSEFQVFYSGFFHHLQDGTLLPEIHHLRMRDTFMLPPDCYVFGNHGLPRMLNIFNQIGLNLSELGQLSDEQGMRIFEALASIYAPLVAHIGIGSGSFNPEAEVVRFVVESITRQIQRALFREGRAIGFVVHSPSPPEDPSDAGSGGEVQEPNYSDWNSFQFPDRIPTPDWDDWDRLQLRELTGVAPVDSLNSFLVASASHITLWFSALRLFHFIIFDLSPILWAILLSKRKRKRQSPQEMRKRK